MSHRYMPSRVWTSSHFLLLVERRPAWNILCMFACWSKKAKNEHLHHPPPTPFGFQCDTMEAWQWAVVAILCTVAVGTLVFVYMMWRDHRVVRERVWDVPVTLMDNERVYIENPSEFGNHSLNDEASDVPHTDFLGPNFLFYRGMGTAEITVLPTGYVEDMQLGAALCLDDVEDMKFHVQHQSGDRIGNSLNDVVADPPSGIWEVCITLSDGTVLHGVSRQSVETSNRAFSESENDMKTLFAGKDDDVVQKSWFFTSPPTTNFHTRMLWAVVGSAEGAKDHRAISLTLREAMEFAGKSKKIANMKIRMFRHVLDQSTEGMELDRDDEARPAQFQRAELRFKVPSNTRGGVGSGDMGRLHIYPVPFEDPGILSFTVREASSYSNGSGVNLQVDVSASSAKALRRLEYLQARSEDEELRWNMYLKLPVAGGDGEEFVSRTETVVASAPSLTSPMTLTWPSDSTAFDGETIANGEGAWLRISMSAESKDEGVNDMFYRSGAISIDSWTSTDAPVPP